jgi:hypothetical protein
VKRFADTLVIVGAVVGGFCVYWLVFAVLTGGAGPKSIGVLMFILSLLSFATMYSAGIITYVNEFKDWW